MEIWQSINAVISGMIIGILLFDWVLRRESAFALAKAREELSESAGKLAVLHNELSQEIIELKDKVAAHEYQLTAKVPPKRPNPF